MINFIYQGKNKNKKIERVVACQQMATCWANQLSLCFYLKVIDIGKHNQGFLEISNFTPHDILISLAYIV